MPKHTTGHLFKRGANYYCRWTHNGTLYSKALRNEKGEPITTQRAAEEAKTNLLAPYVVSDEVAVLESLAAKVDSRKAELAKLELEQNPPLAISQAWAQFIAASNRPDTGEATLRQYGFQFKAFKEWMDEKHPAALLMRDVTEEIAQEYASILNGGRFSPGTYNKHLNLLTLVFRVLKKKARLAINPWEDITRKKLASHSRRELTVDELKKVCQSAEGELRTLLAIGIYSGLRLGDCATLRWCEVDLPRSIIRRVPNKTARSKPNKAVTIPVHPVLADMLAQTPLEKRGEHVLPDTAALYRQRIDAVTDLVQNHFIKCGIKVHKPGTGENGKRAILEVGFHSLRHTFVSLCREKDAPLSVVESIVGHSNPTMTRLYTHTGVPAAEKAVAALPSIIGEEKPVLALPEPTQANLLTQIRETLASMNRKNWTAKRNELLAILASAPVAQLKPEAMA